MPSSFPVFGVTLHFYGLLIGIAMIVVAQISELLLKRQGYKAEAIWEIALPVILVGLIGARAWHVITDWHLYASDIIKSLYVWQGGMSIVGGLLGGFIGLYFSRNILKKYSISLLTAMDVFAISLPFGQAVGRLGNWVNQELYGYPTDLPWKLFIDEEYRKEGFEEYQFFHPLFAYEAILLILLGMSLWKLSQIKSFAIGHGTLALLYLTIYSAVRFFLEFLRIEKTTINGGSLGVNQAIMLVVSVLSLFVLCRRWQLQKAKNDKN